ncbi:kinase-like domain-containing protein [Trichoderma chlorosporum]
MSLPREHLPLAVPEDSIRALIASLDLPPPQSVTTMSTTAEYHSIYVISFEPEVAATFFPTLLRPNKDSVEFILRISGHHLPRIKTINEVATMTWVRQNTRLPIAEVIRYDASTDNPLGHEFTLLERLPGVPVSEVYDRLSPELLDSLINQMIDVIHQIHSVSWNCVSGLQFDNEGNVVPGPIVEETFWQQPDVARYWPDSESVGSLNIGGPYKCYTDYITAMVRVYQHALRLHPSLADMRDLLPRLDDFVNTLPRFPELDGTRYFLAHKDLHFANIMFDEVSGRITGILDWEFSGIVPAPRWNPVRAFLWNGQYSEGAMKERDRINTLFEARCAEQGLISLVEETKVSSTMLKAIQEVANYLRAIIEVRPRGQKEERVLSWRATLESQLKIMGV